MKKIVLIVAATAVCATASAQTSNFAGFSGALNLNTVSVNSKLSSGGGSVDGLGQQSWGASIQGAYGFATSATTVVSVGGTYALGDIKAGTASPSTEMTVKDAYSVYVEPGFLLNDKTLAYGKLSYESVNGRLASGGQSASKSANGTGFGFGVRTMLNSSSFIQVEFKQADYGTVDVGSNSSVHPTSTTGTVGVGMKF